MPRRKPRRVRLCTINIGYYPPPFQASKRPVCTNRPRWRVCRFATSHRHERRVLTCRQGGAGTSLRVYSASYIYITSTVDRTTTEAIVSLLRLASPQRCLQLDVTASLCSLDSNCSKLGQINLNREGIAHEASPRVICNEEENGRATATANGG